MIIKDDKMVMHCQCENKLTEQEAREAIEFYLDSIKRIGKGGYAASQLKYFSFEEI
jgi:hypothetical protein